MNRLDSQPQRPADIKVLTHTGEVSLDPKKPYSVKITGEQHPRKLRGEEVQRTLQDLGLDPLTTAVDIIKITEPLRYLNASEIRRRHSTRNSLAPGLPEIDVFSCLPERIRQIAFGNKNTSKRRIR